MRAFVFALVAAIALAIGFALALVPLQEPADEAYTTESVRNH
jgi:hypothetical protein